MTPAKKPTTNPEAIPMTPLLKQPSYAKAAEEIASLAAALGKVSSRIAEIEALMRMSAPDPESDHVAAALHFASTGTVRAASHNPTALSDEHLALRLQRDALEKAIEARTVALRQIVSELSEVVSRAVEPAHRKIAARFLKKLEELDALFQEEETMINGIQAEGYQARFRNVIAWPYIGTMKLRGESALFNHHRSLEHYAAKGE